MFYPIFFNLLSPIIRKYFKKRAKKDPRYGEHLGERFAGNYEISTDFKSKLDNAVNFIASSDLQGAQSLKGRSLHFHCASVGEFNAVQSLIRSLLLIQRIHSNLFKGEVESEKEVALQIVKDFLELKKYFPLVETPKNFLKEFSKESKSKGENLGVESLLANQELATSIHNLAKLGISLYGLSDYDLSSGVDSDENSVEDSYEDSEVNAKANSCREQDLLRGFKALVMEFCSQLSPQVLLPIVVSCSTPTGREQINKLKESFPGNIEVCYAPLEFKGAIANFIKTFDPEISYFVEAEIWPLFIEQLAKHHPVYLLNARIYPRKYAKYRSGLIRKSLTKFSAIYCQNLESNLLFTSALHKVKKTKLAELLGQVKHESFSSQDLELKFKSTIAYIHQQDNLEQNPSNLSEVQPLITTIPNLKFSKYINQDLVHLLKADGSVENEKEHDKILNPDSQLENQPPKNNANRGFLGDKPGLLISSTYPDEIASICLGLKQASAVDKFKLIVAPRHPENVLSIKAELEKLYPEKQIVYLSDIQAQFRDLYAQLEQEVQQQRSNQENSGFRSESSAESSVSWKQRALAKLQEILQILD